MMSTQNFIKLTKKQAKNNEEFQPKGRKLNKTKRGDSDKYKW